MRHTMLFFAGGLSLSACGTQAPVDEQAPIVAETLDDVAVSITPGPLPEVARADDRAGLVIALLELGLADLPGVVPEVVGAPLSPGLNWALRPASAYDLEVTVVLQEGLTVTGSLCPSGVGAECVTLQGQSPGQDDPTPAVAALLQGVADHLERQASPDARAAWLERGTRDDYAARMAGRSAATFYGLRAPSGTPGDKRSDPVARAFYLDPGMPVAAWMAARTSTERHPVAARRASVSRPSSVLLLADLAWSLEHPRVATPVIDALHQRAPLDRRFSVAVAAHRLAMGRLEEASAVLDGLGRGSGRDPQVARMRVAIADAAGPQVALELLEAWAKADPSDPEPVRRLLHRAVAVHDYREARGYLPELRSRGGVGVDELDLALWFALGQADRAAEVAERTGDATLAHRLRAYQAPPAPGPAGLPRVGG
jgi:hypothetical protein